MKIVSGNESKQFKQFMKIFFLITNLVLKKMKCLWHCAISNDAWQINEVKYLLQIASHKPEALCGIKLGY